MHVHENRVLWFRRTVSCALFGTKEEIQIVSAQEGVICPPLRKVARQLERKVIFLALLLDEWRQTCQWPAASLAHGDRIILIETKQL